MLQIIKNSFEGSYVLNQISRSEMGSSTNSSVQKYLNDCYLKTKYVLVPIDAVVLLVDESTK